MESKKLFAKYHSRVVRMGLLKSLLLSLILGFLVTLILALISWAKSFSPFIALGVGLGIIAITMPLFYLRFFKPTTKDIARLVDQLGLEERLVTMYELENDESYIAMVQREDAKEKIKSVNAKMMTFKFSKAIIAIACVVVVLGLSATALAELSILEIIPPLGQVWTDIIPPEPLDEFDVIYEVRGSGYILGELSQKVQEGSDGSEVVAVEDEGFYFVGWSWLDERSVQRMSENPIRQEKEVKSNLTITAIFEPIDNPDDLLKGMEGENPETPPRDLTGNQTGGGGGGDDGGPSDNPNPGPGSDSDTDSPMDNNENNTIIDGNTDYQSEFDYDGEMDDLTGDNSLPPEIKDAVSDYFKNLKNP